MTCGRFEGNATAHTAPISGTVHRPIKNTRCSKPPVDRNGAIGELLELYLLQNRLGVRELASALGVSASTISRIINGHRMDSSTMLSLMSWLFGSTGSKEKKLR
jgi:hypothetical protein